MRAGGGLIYAPERGWRGSLTSNWIGTHWLNSLNTFEAPAYAVVDASLGYRFEKFTMAVLGSNLGNRRDAGAAERARRRTVLSHAGAPHRCDVDLALPPITAGLDPSQSAVTPSADTG